MAKTHDYSTWLTKRQAAELLGVSTKTIENYADAGKIQQAKWNRPGGGKGSWIVVYHPDDVERLNQERTPDMESIATPPVSTGIAVVRQSIQEQLIRAFSETSHLSQQRLSEKLYLTAHEAVVYTGLGVSYLRRLVDNGTLSPLKGAGPRGASVFRRVDLEKL